MPSNYFIYVTVLSGLSIISLVFHIQSSIKRVDKICPIHRNLSSTSACSEKASLKGLHQKVISFSVFIKSGESDYVFKRYVPGIWENFKKMREIYPGWLMRLYTNINPNDMEEIRNLQSQPDFFICDVECLPVLKDLSQLDGRVWRFLPMFDPTVDIFIVRDLDSALNDRERSAVREWEKSDKIFHNMRDHPLHSAPIMAGMWGGKNDMMSDFIKMTLSTAFTKIVTCNKLNDQEMLEVALYHPFQTHFLIHDSYFCQKLPFSVPFPTERKDITHFVGGTFLDSDQIVAACPDACRPDYGKNWTYC